MISESKVVDALLKFQKESYLYYQNLFYEKANDKHDDSYSPNERKKFNMPNGNISVMNAFDMYNAWCSFNKREKEIFDLYYDVGTILRRSYPNENNKYTFICERFRKMMKQN